MLNETSTYPIIDFVVSWLKGVNDFCNKDEYS